MKENCPAVSGSPCIPWSPVTIHLHSHLLGFTSICECLVQAVPKLSRILQMCSHKCQMKGRNHFPWSAGYTFANTAQCVVVSAARSCCWLLFNLLPKTFSAKLFSIWLAPSLYRVIPTERYRTLPLWNFARFLSGHYSSHLRYLWITDIPSSL